MRKIDHVRKTVYLIVGCLTIFSLVLTICHKVGHCASSDPEVIDRVEFPLICDGLIGFDNNPDFNNIYKQGVLDAVANIRTDDSRVICFYEKYTNSIKFNVYFLPNGANYYFCQYSNSPTVARNAPNIKLYARRAIVTYTISTGSYSVDTSRLGYGASDNDVVYFNPILSDLPDNSFSYNTGYFVYPLYIDPNISKPNLYYGVSNSNFTDSQTLAFTDRVIEEPVGPIGHSKGGVLSNYIDSDDLIEQDSSLPTVDTSSPADPSSNSGWFQKILNGLSKINQSIKGGVLTIGDYIGQGFENVINWLTEPFDQEAFSDELDQVFLLSDILGAKDLLDQSGLFDWEDITPSQNVSWTFDFGGAVLPHTSCTIDFSWYTGTVKNLIVTLICTFLVVGLLATLFNSIPSIISGHSGDKGGGSDS